MPFSTSHLFGLTATIALALACGSPPPPEEPASESEAPAAAPAEVSAANIPEKSPSRGQILISDRIKEACGITASDTRFDYDSAKISPQAQSVLEKLAACFKDGPLAGELMKLVGYADPRGDEEYNLALGGKRAESVKSLLTKFGLSADKISTTSRGEMDAQGTDEESWALDRKVEVKVDD